MRRLILSSLMFFSLTSCGQALAKEPITNYEVLFSPNDHVAEELISLIGKEKKSIKAAIYCLMHHRIAKALIEAHQRGVHVEVIVDSYSVKVRSPLKKMAEANLPLYVWDPVTPVVVKGGRTIKKRKPLMHDKFCVLGDSQVWTGSFNFTFEAEKHNQENVIFLENTGLAEKFSKEFERLKKSGCVLYKDFVLKKK